MTFPEHSTEVFQKVRDLYHEAVSGSISAALIRAMRFGYELGRRDLEEERMEEEE